MIAASYDGFQMGSNHLAEIGEMREMAFTVKKRAAKLSFQLLNGARERGLRDVALLAAREKFNSCCNGKKITDLMHFHGGTPS